jgi:glycosyltransferase involved in cell wall biosynthesis
MPSLWFIVPAHGRQQLAAICLRQLRRTCDQLTDNGIDATAVVIADDQNLTTAKELGFGWVKRDNRWLSRKFNDGIQLAMDKTHNPRPADFVVPIGSDDWVDWRLFTDLPAGRTMVGFQHMSFVREDGLELTTRFLDYPGGCGIRIYPRNVMRMVGYRPADENRRNGCDTSILVNLRRAEALRRIEHRVTDPLQIVDWKSPEDQVTAYKEIAARHRHGDTGDPFDMLTGRFPDEALEDMRAHYAANVLVGA